MLRFLGDNPSYILKLLGLSFIQSFLLMLSQVFLKFAVMNFGGFDFSFESFKSTLTNYYGIIAGGCMTIATIIWMYLLKHYPLSLAYPLGSLSYVFGLIAAILFFHEHVSPTRWIGVCIIIIGIYFVTKQ
jgi:drug/metabolite transporter (DMT)-like permease